jgi:predicted nucleic acid-binding protein
MPPREAVCVDSGAWIALALSRDPLHAQAREQWDRLQGASAALYNSIPVVIETFTFLDRNANRAVALKWKEAIGAPRTVTILPCEARDLEQSWAYFRRSDLHKLSLSMLPALPSCDGCVFGLPSPSITIFRSLGLDCCHNGWHHALRPLPGPTQRRGGGACWPCCPCAA